MPMIYDMLHQDHEKVKRALNNIIESGDGAEKTREKLFSEIKHDLEIHTRFEEEVFYPQEEHGEAKGMLEKLAAMDKTSDTFIESLKDLKDALEHHISDEEDEMFPQAREALDDDKAQEMGGRYQQMKQG